MDSFTTVCRASWRDCCAAFTQPAAKGRNKNTSQCSLRKNIPEGSQEAVPHPRLSEQGAGNSKGCARLCMCMRHHSMSKLEVQLLLSLKCGSSFIWENTVFGIKSSGKYYDAAL